MATYAQLALSSAEHALVINLAKYVLKVMLKI
jgi:hypothetical protein